jgi:GntR family transcriptional regulator
MSTPDVSTVHPSPSSGDDLNGHRSDWTARTIRDRRPLYVRVVEEFEDYVRQHGLQAGMRLPSESQLSEVFGVGRSTMREAMSHLEMVGVVERRHGLGTILKDRRRSPVVGLETLEALETLAKRQGWECGTVDVQFETRLVTKPEAALFGVDEATTLTRLLRTKTRDGQPFAVIDSLVPLRTMNAETLRQEFVDCFVEVLMQATGPDRLDYIRAKVSAMACRDVDVQHRLRITRRAPVLVLQELCMSKDDALLAINKLFFIPDAIELEVIRRP